MSTKTCRAAATANQFLHSWSKEGYMDTGDAVEVIEALLSCIEFAVEVIFCFSNEQWSTEVVYIPYSDIESAFGSVEWDREVTTWVEEHKMPLSSHSDVVYVGIYNHSPDEEKSC